MAGAGKGMFRDLSPDPRAQGRVLGRAAPQTHRGRRLEEAGDLFSLTTAPSAINIKKIKSIKACSSLLFSTVAMAEAPI